MIDFSKVVVGDKVLIEAKVVQVDKNDTERPLGISIGEDLIPHKRWPHKDAFVSHIPRSPEVGDEVNIEGCGGMSATVVGLDENDAWVKWSDHTHSTHKLERLTVTKRKSSI